MAIDTKRHEEADKSAERVWQSREMQWSAGSGVLLAIGFVVETMFHNEGLATGLWVLATLAGIRFFAREAAEDLWREREVGIELLILAA